MKNPEAMPSTTILEFPQMNSIRRLMPLSAEELASSNASNTSDYGKAAPLKNFGLDRDFRFGDYGDFLNKLRLEKLRAQRSGSPLSIALYRIQPENECIEGLGVFQLLESLDTTSRETDIIGYIGDEVIAVLCPDTDAEGLKTFVGKINALTGGAWTPKDIATYPNELFEGLAALHRRTSEMQSLITGEYLKTQRNGYRLKRCIDILGSMCALAIFSPLMLLVAIAIAVTSPGPIFFKQLRLGKGGISFWCYKFRSMVANVDDNIHREFVASLINGESSHAQDASGEVPLFKIKADPRITWIGNIIRKTSIDELPQLFNVLKGEMSLVGPRPPIPYEAENYKAWHLRRVLSAMPGITGLWQVEGRSRVTFDEMVRMDLRYIRDCSLGLDIKILLKTIKVVLRGEGAQ
ncbi:sugar transferase [Azohydromonas lata]|uniref:Sugar transferase n=1 Tax=Azohydromonas lata TaxID=45677 RepID=A0ABU5IBK7_9BURK|nr:sugar transferase [Azohydromonas lata]MDZ5455991.1 sugar transferase [Azohydromonas lata]